MLSVQTLDRKIWRKDSIILYLTQCVKQNTPAEINLLPEGPCAESMGLYRLLDCFCAETGFPKANITIITANMLEAHPEYNIQHNSSIGWYEIDSINQWLSDKTIDSGSTPTKHFANFTSRSNWARLWLATIIDNQHKEKALQTYHYDPSRENYNYNGYLGLDDLFKFGCNVVPEAAKFLTTCPRTIDLEFLKTSDHTSSAFQHANSYYPIQYPANLNLLQFYSDIFVDVYAETNLAGNCFTVTEKTWRPILAQRPFIVLSNPGFLHNLRKLEFKTFNDFWDESYDDYGDGDRITQIEQLLEDIAAWPIDRCRDMLVEMQSILEHNYTTFVNLTTAKVTEVFCGTNN